MRLPRLSCRSPEVSKVFNHEPSFSWVFFAWSPMNQDEDPTFSRFVDLRIPLWGLICAFAAAAYFIVGTWFTAGQTAKDVNELQITVKAGNQQVTTLSGEQALLRFRMENIEGEIRALKALKALQAETPTSTMPSTTTTTRRFP